jgi:DNA-binding NtrC family response regulator
MKTVVKAMQRGVNGYIIKPFTEKTVKEKLNMLGFKTREPEPEPMPPKISKPAKPSAAVSDEDFLVTKF